MLEEDYSHLKVHEVSTLRVIKKGLSMGLQPVGRWLGYDRQKLLQEVILELKMRANLRRNK